MYKRNSLTTILITILFFLVTAIPVFASSTNTLEFQTGTYVQLPNNLLMASPITLEAQFSTTSVGSIIGMQDSAVNQSVNDWVPVIYVGEDGKLRAELYNGGSAHPIVSSQVVNDGKVHNVALVANQNSQTLYLDGVNVGSLSGTIINYQMVFNEIGNAYTNGWPDTNGAWYGFNGIIKNVSLWNQERTSSQIQSDFDNGLTGNEAGLIGYWKLNDGNSVALDSSVNHNNGTIVGGTWVSSPTPTVGASKADNVNVTTTVDPTITIALNTNSLDFGHINPLTTKTLPSAVTIIVQSNNSYTLSCIGNSDIVGTLNPNDIIPINKLQLKLSSQTNYLSESKISPVVLADNQPNTSMTTYFLDFELLTDWTANPDTYSVLSSFAVSQVS